MNTPAYKLHIHYVNMKWLRYIFVMLQELLEKLVKGDLSKSDYLCMNQSSHKEESEARTGSVRKSSAPTAVPERKATPHSMRSRRTATWARPHSSDDGYSRHSILHNDFLFFGPFERSLGFF